MLGVFVNAGTSNMDAARRVSDRSFAEWRVMVITLGISCEDPVLKTANSSNPMDITGNMSGYTTNVPGNGTRVVVVNSVDGGASGGLDKVTVSVGLVVNMTVVGTHWVSPDLVITGPPSVTFTSAVTAVGTAVAHTW